MINPHKLELPLSLTYFYGFKGVRAIGILLYMAHLQNKRAPADENTQDLPQQGLKLLRNCKRNSITNSY